ncbi:MAG: PAS domain-containing protein [Actinobacteria bacterium]|nr:PAS domain-containing protein [Actinomycetota bacterium]
MTVLPFDDAEWLRSVLDHLDEAVLVIARDGQLLWANAAARDLLSGRESAAVGSLLPEGWQVIDTDGQPVPLDELPAVRTLRTGEAITRRTLGALEGGKPRWFDVSTRPLLGEGGDVAAVVVSVADVSARQEAEAELWYRLAYEDLVAGVSRAFISVEPEEIDDRVDRALADVGEFLEVLHVAAFEHDLRAGALVLSHEWSADPARLRIATRIDLDDTPNLREALLDLEPFVAIDTRQLPDLERTLLEGESVAVVPVPSGLRLGACMLAQRPAGESWSVDAIRLLRGVGELIATVVQRRQAAELTDAVYSRLQRSNEDLEHLNRELIRANQAKDEFLSVASHELRSPLVSITGFTETLQKRWASLTDDERHRYIEVVGRQAQRLHHLVEELLETSRISSGHVRVTPELHSALDFVSELLDEVRDPGTEVRGDASVRFEADPDHVRRMIANLVENARKYGAPPIRVTIGAEDEFVTIEVRDHGAGVPERFVPRLFERFARAEEDPDTTGTGLGLSIVRDLAVLNGGGITYERADPGAAFTVRLPRG